MQRELLNYLALFLAHSLRNDIEPTLPNFYEWLEANE